MQHQTWPWAGDLAGGIMLDRTIPVPGSLSLGGRMQWPRFVS
jgi:hypothetical protein